MPSCSAGSPGRSPRAGEVELLGLQAGELLLAELLLGLLPSKSSLPSLPLLPLAVEAAEETLQGRLAVAPALELALPLLFDSALPLLLLLPPAGGEGFCTMGMDALRDIFCGVTSSRPRFLLYKS